MRKMIVLMMSACCLLSAEGTDVVDRVPVGVREMNPKERLLVQERRAERERNAPKEETTEETLEEGIQVKKGFNASSVTVDYTSHMGAYHHPLIITPLGDAVELEDGSIWSVNFNDRNKTYNWLTSDTLKITPNKSWFSSYKYRLTNLNTNESIEVNLIERPIYNGVYTHWIISIDSLHDQLCLEDGSVWSLSGFDYSIYRKWILNDTIIIGHNDGFLSSTRPNILINCDTNDHVDARCLN